MEKIIGLMLVVLAAYTLYAVTTGNILFIG